jgi:hypothetical protein
MANTPDQYVADAIGQALDREISYRMDERRTLLAAATRILDIDAELLALQTEKARIEPRRPPRPEFPTLPGGTVVDVPAPSRVR